MENSLEAKRRSGEPRILIVGGVAGGASCAARARRMSEKAGIIMFERGPYVSFANCGLPYYVGDVITDERDLLIATPQLFKDRFNIEVRVRSEVRSIDRQRHEIEVRNGETGKLYREKYDALVLAPGAAPVRPPLQGIDLPGIFSLRTIPDSRQIREQIAEKKAKRAVVVGGGFIGLETTENLVRRGISVTIVEMLAQVMPPVDPEMAVPIQEHLIANGVSLRLGDSVAGFEQNPEGNTISVITRSGGRYVCDMVLLAIGVRPEVTLAKDAGLEIGRLGGIRVDDQMRTTDERIWAVGDAVEVRDFVGGEWSLFPLAGVANRQGRIAADVILGREARFRGGQGTIVCKVFDITVAATGMSEKSLNRGKPGDWKQHYEKVYLHPGHHVNYYPGAKPITMKLIFSTEDGKILGAQAIGEEGVEKRVDVIAMAIQKGATVFDLEEAELCYTPQFGAAKDPVNIAGMIAANALRGDAPVAHWADVRPLQSYVLDVREPDEFDLDHVEGASNIPLHSIRGRMSELPRDREILVYCAAGQRSYYASRVLRLNGFPAKNISGGMKTYHGEGSEPASEKSEDTLPPE
ncbi:MAG: FAD-dependent oxidoreductase [Dehalococcoidia bacterium]|nr:FAD-dependent oxidoreductase [Dehalococcoidia bacterium]MDH4367659.1 FAD-dependent oxidoreductase [Dehalococcoidia bacterium]